MTETHDLAARIERAECIFLAACAARRGFAIPLAGGVATFVEPGSPFNKVAGLGFDGVPDAAALAGIERAFAGPVHVELSSLADPALGRLFTERGYRLVEFEHVLARPLDGDLASPPDVRRSPDEEFETWLDVVVEGALGGGFSRAILAAAERDQATTDGAMRYLAWRDGAPVGGAAMRVTGEGAGGIAQFFAASTLPAHRRRGVQGALLAARLADARAAGCDLAVVTTSPGTQSQRNVERAGFRLVYARAVLAAAG